MKIRNALNVGIARGRFTMSGRDAAWKEFSAQVEAGAFVFRGLNFGILFAKAQELSDRHTPLYSTRSLDLLHVSAALLLGARKK